MRENKTKQKKIVLLLKCDKKRKKKKKRRRRNGHDWMSHANEIVIIPSPSLLPLTATYVVAIIQGHHHSLLIG